MRIPLAGLQGKLNDFARNASVLIKQIDGAHSVIAICDDDFPIAWISDEQQRRKFLAGRNFHMIFLYVRIESRALRLELRMESQTRDPYGHNVVNLLTPKKRGSRRPALHYP